MEEEFDIPFGNCLPGKERPHLLIRVNTYYSIHLVDQDGDDVNLTPSVMLDGFDFDSLCTAMAKIAKRFERDDADDQ